MAFVDSQIMILSCFRAKLDLSIESFLALLLLGDELLQALILWYYKIAKAGYSSSSFGFRALSKVAIQSGVRHRYKNGTEDPLAQNREQGGIIV